MERLSRCRLCNETTLASIPEWGDVPAGIGRRPEQDKGTVNSEVVGVVCCTSCGAIQTDHVIWPIRHFADALDFHANTLRDRKESIQIRDWLRTQGFIRSGDFILEIGSNDGTFLRSLQAVGCDVLGLEVSPFRVARAVRCGVPTIYGLFSSGLADYLKRYYPSPRVVVCRDVLTTFVDIPLTLHLIAKLLPSEGALVLKLRHALGMKGQLAGEWLNAANPCAVTVQGLVHLATLCGFTITALAESAISSDSIIAIFRPCVMPINNDKIITYLRKECEEKLGHISTWKSFAHLWKQMTRQLSCGLMSLKSKASCLAGYAATPEALTLLHMAGIGREILDAVIDPNPQAEGWRTQIADLPILAAPQSHFAWDYVVVLDRTLQQDAMNWASQQLGIRMLLPFPRLHEIQVQGPIPIAA